MSGVVMNFPEIKKSNETRKEMKETLGQLNSLSESLNGLSAAFKKAGDQNMEVCDALKGFGDKIDDMIAHPEKYKNAKLGETEYATKEDMLKLIQEVEELQRK